MATKDLVLDLLSQGISPVQVAETVGVSESYISQLMGDESFQASVQEHKARMAAEDLAHDKRVETIEAKFLDNIEKKAPLANLQQSLQAFKILNTAKKRRDGVIQAGGPKAGVVVQILLPNSIVPQYVTNRNNEIVEVEGKTMVSIAPKKLDEIVAARNNGTAQKLGIPTVTPTELAHQALEVLDNKPVRRLTQRVASKDLADFL